MEAAIWTVSVSDKVQSDGDQSFDISDFPVGYRHLSNWQGHFELSATPTAGTASIYGVPVEGAAAKKVLLAEVDLTSTDALALIKHWVGVYDSIVISPDSFDADKTYSFILTAYSS
jgi:hypothetical protein